jgi:hypothetical protein
MSKGYNFLRIRGIPMMRKDKLQGIGVILIALGVLIFLGCQFVASGAVHGNECAEGEGSSSQCKTYNDEMNAVCFSALLGIIMTLVGIGLIVYSYIRRKPQNYPQNQSGYPNQNQHDNISNYQQSPNVNNSIPSKAHLIDKMIVVKPKMFEELELGYLSPDDRIEGTLRQDDKKDFFYYFLDEAGLMAYHKDEEDTRAINSGGKKFLYDIDILIIKLGRYYLVVENYYEDRTIDIDVELKIIKPS